MKALFESPVLLIVVLLAILLWGGPKLPGLAKSLGESMRIFRKEMKTMGEEKDAEKKDKAQEDKPSDK
ncbi:MAG: twin-arginine translocase TatA/TatE family subunit [Micrococcales bacterium]